jgi:hypothetical protein
VRSGEDLDIIFPKSEDPNPSDRGSHTWTDRPNGVILFFDESSKEQAEPYINSDIRFDPDSDSYYSIANRDYFLNQLDSNYGIGGNADVKFELLNQKDVGSGNESDEMDADECTIL